MTTTEKRLDEAVLALTASERAVLILRPWIAGGEANHRLRKHAPSDQKEEVERIEQAINDYNQKLFQALAFVLEWVTLSDTELAWLECLAGFLKREDANRSRSSARGTLPPPKRAWKRDLPMLYGKLANDSEEPPSDWPGARERLMRDVSRSLQLRWSEYVAWQQVRADLKEVMGEEMLHVQGREVIEAIGQKVTEMREALERLSGPVDLGRPTAEQMEVAREYVDWKALKPATLEPGPNNGRGYMRPQELAELEALEARVAADLRAQRRAESESS